MTDTGKAHSYITVEVLRQSLYDQGILEVLGELLARLNIQGVSGIKSRVENVRRMRAFAEGQFDRVLFVGLPSSMVALIQFKCDV